MAAINYFLNNPLIDTILSENETIQDRDGWTKVPIKQNKSK